MSRARVVRLLAWGPPALSALCLAAVVVLGAQGCPPTGLVLTAPLILTSAGFSLLSLLIIYHRPENRIGRLSAFIGVCASLMFAANYYVECSPIASSGLAGGAPVGVPPWPITWLGYVLPTAFIAGMFIALPLLFPDGNFLSPGWRRFAILSFGALAILGLAIATLPGTLQYNGMGVAYPYQNPLGLPILPEEAGPALNRAINSVIILSTLAAIMSQVQRWRRSSGDTRQQLKWFAFFLATAVTVQMVVEAYGALVNPAVFTAFGGLLYGAVLMLVFGGFPLTVGIAVFKYRLYDIDIIIRRTLTYGALSIVLALFYFGSIILLQSAVRALTGQESPLVIVLSTLFIAALFTPLRRKLQDSIDRRFYRRKYDAARTLAAFAKSARDEVELESLTGELVHVVEETLQPELVAIWIRDASPGSRALSQASARKS